MGAPADSEPGSQVSRRAPQRVGAQQELPRWAKRLPATSMAGVTWAVVLLVTGCFLCANEMAQWFDSGTVLAVYLIVVYVCCVGMVQSSHAAALKALVPRKGMICPRCHFPLPMELDEGVCPECGTRYDRARVVRMWRTLYKLDKHLPSDEELARLPRPVEPAHSEPPRHPSEPQT